MIRRFQLVIGVALALVLVLTSAVTSRNALEDNYKSHNSNFSSAPAICIAAHRVGNIVLAVNNAGSFGNGFRGGSDCFTGQAVPSCEFPKRSGVDYLFAAAFWIGAISGRDTLVSTGEDGWLSGNEMKPDEAPLGNMIKRSLIDPASPQFEGAVSEEDLIAVYFDTTTSPAPPADPRDNRPHQPLYIRINQNSYAWSYSYAEDFVLFDYKITNIGVNPLNKVYMGIYVDADVCFTADCDLGFTDDICGFVHTVPETTYTGAIYLDTVNLAWISDEDGDPS